MSPRVSGHILCFWWNPFQRVKCHALTQGEENPRIMVRSSYWLGSALVVLGIISIAAVAFGVVESQHNEQLENQAEATRTISLEQARWDAQKVDQEALETEILRRNEDLQARFDKLTTTATALEETASYLPRTNDVLQKNLHILSQIPEKINQWKASSNVTEKERLSTLQAWQGSSTIVQEQLAKLTHSSDDNGTDLSATIHNFHRKVKQWMGGVKSSAPMGPKLPASGTDELMTHSHMSKSTLNTLEKFTFPMTMTEVQSVGQVPGTSDLHSYEAKLHGAAAWFQVSERNHQVVAYEEQSSSQGPARYDVEEARTAAKTWLNRRGFSSLVWTNTSRIGNMCYITFVAKQGDRMVDKKSVVVKVNLLNNQVVGMNAISWFNHQVKPVSTAQTVMSSNQFSGLFSSSFHPKVYRPAWYAAADGAYIPATSILGTEHGHTFDVVVSDKSKAILDIRYLD
jgi:hypothetical protein